MENNLRSHPDSMLVEGTPFDHIGFHGVIAHGYQLESKRLDDRGRRNAMC